MANTIESNAGYGIRGYSSNDVLIDNNLIDNNEQVGIGIFGSQDFQISSNTITNHIDNQGIYLGYTDDGFMVMGNRIIHNKEGIWVELVSNSNFTRSINCNSCCQVYKINAGCYNQEYPDN